MELRRTSIRRATVAGLAFVLVAGLSSCSGSDRAAVRSTPAATVNGTDISRAEVTKLTKANQNFYEQSIANGQDSDGQLAALLEDTKGVSEDTVGINGAADALGSLITTEVMRQELEAQDAEPTKDDLKAARTELETAAAGGDASVDGRKALAEYDKDFVDYSVTSRAIYRAFQSYLATEADKDNKPLTEEERQAEMLALYEQTKPTMPLCLNIILVATEDEANAAKARVDGDEDFGAVAAEVSLETQSAQNGGFAGCAAVDAASSAFGIDFAPLAVGDVVGPAPYATQEGAAPQFAVIQVQSVDGPTYEQLLPRLESSVPAEPVATDPTQVDVTEALAKAIKKAKVTIDDRFGTWDAATATVTPPEVPGTTTTTTTSLPTLSPDATIPEATTPDTTTPGN